MTMLQRCCYFQIEKKDCNPRMLRMLRKVISIVFLFTLIMSCSAAAQEKPELEEILARFPYGDYDSIYHRDNEWLKKAEVYGIYAGVVRQSPPDWQYAGPLPPAFTEPFRSPGIRESIPPRRNV